MNLIRTEVLEDVLRSRHIFDAQFFSLSRCQELAHYDCRAIIWSSFVPRVQLKIVYASRGVSLVIYVCRRLHSLSAAMLRLDKQADVDIRSMTIAMPLCNIILWETIGTVTCKTQSRSSSDQALFWGQRDLHVCLVCKVCVWHHHLEPHLILLYHSYLSPLYPLR